MKKIVIGLLLTGLAAGQLQAAPAAGKPLSLEQRVDLLERKLKAMSDMVIKLDTLQREVQQLRGEVEVQNHAMDALKKRQRDLYLDVDQRLNQLSHGTAAPAVPDMSAQPMPESTATPDSQAPVASASAASQTASTPAPQIASSQPLPPVDPVAEEKAYKAAFELLMQRRYEEAQGAFQTFLGDYPNGNYADNAQYWLAEASYVTRNFDKALVDFQAVIERFPNSSKVPDALLKSSFIYYEKQQWAEARQALELLQRRYPNTTASRLATKRLQRMQSEGH